MRKGLFLEIQVVGPSLQLAKTKKYKSHQLHLMAFVLPPFNSVLACLKVVQAFKPSRKNDFPYEKQFLLSIYYYKLFTLPFSSPNC